MGFVFSVVYAYSVIEVAVVQQVVCWLIRCKARVRIPGQSSKTKYEKYYFGDFLSQQICGKNSKNK